MQPWSSHLPRPRSPRFSRLAVREHALLLLAVLGSRAAREAEQSLSLCGIDSRDFAILEYLAHAAGPVPQGTLAFQLGRDRTTIMRLTRSLTAKGLATPIHDDRDGRGRAPQISPSGLDVHRTPPG